MECGAIRDWEPRATTSTEFGSRLRLVQHPGCCSVHGVYISPSFQCAMDKSLSHYTMLLVEQRRLVVRLIAYALPICSVRYWWTAWRSNYSISQTSYPQRPRCIAHHPPGADLPIAMTLLESDPSRSSPHSRAALVVAHAVVDSQYVSLFN